MTIEVQTDFSLQGSSETYLGDGLYASFDGYQIVLRAPRLEGDHVVALEGAVFKELLHFADRLKLNGKKLFDSGRPSLQGVES